ncbi:MAG: phage tail protein [Candidatus Omnitrophica bacterium]|nr:phage tail protein [Candidatus Omnitrophota bacterium]
MSFMDLLENNDQKVGITHGVAAGLVTKNDDPNKLGKIKITFPWLPDDNETDWIRMTTFMAGLEMGGIFLPEVGDEVLVAFEHGDLNRPYVIGALWNGKAKPPEADYVKNNIRKIKSRSGHEIIFNDDKESSKEKIEIHTNANHKIIMDDSEGKEKIEIIDKTGNNKITIDSVQNSINIESALNLKIKANVIEIEGTTSLTLKSNANLTIQGLPVKIN